MRAYINLITWEVTKAQPSDPHLLLEMTVEEAEDTTEYDRTVELIVKVPVGTFLRLGLAPQGKPTMN